MTRAQAVAIGIVILFAAFAIFFLVKLVAGQGI
jgi:hypothetical protein